MTYLIELERYGRKETVFDVASFAADLAPLIGGTVEPHDPDRYITGDAEHIRVDGMLIGVYANRHDSKGKVHFSASAVDVPIGDRPYHDGKGTYKMPDAYVSASRPIEAIAKDVKRRVIDAAAVPLANIREYAARQQASRDSLSAVCGRLAAAVPEMKETKNGASDNHKLNMWWHDSTHSVYLNARVYSDGQVGIDRIGNLSLEAFIEIADVLRRHSKKRA